MQISFEWVHKKSEMYPEVSYDVKPLSGEQFIRLQSVMLMYSDQGKGNKRITEDMFNAVKALAEDTFPSR